jgi:hypothetical protein
VFHLIWFEIWAPPIMIVLIARINSFGKRAPADKTTDGTADGTTALRASRNFGIKTM